jgi:predicted neutral ceramidase superfamily lipid hydrolase
MANQASTYCSVCRNSLKTVNYEKHLASASHQRNLVSSRDVEKVKCSVCNKSILIRNIEEHL